MRVIVKKLRAQTSEHVSKFCEKIEQRPHFALENFNGPFHNYNKNNNNNINNSNN